MTKWVQELSNKHDALFQMNGGTLHVNVGNSPHCGYPAIMEYVKTAGEPLPLSPERMKQIEILIIQAKYKQQKHGNYWNVPSSLSECPIDLASN